VSSISVESPDDPVKVVSRKLRVCKSPTLTVHVASFTGFALADTDTLVTCHVSRADSGPDFNSPVPAPERKPDCESSLTVVNLHNGHPSRSSERVNPHRVFVAEVEAD
jgi:hypothetical protein